MSSNSHIRIYAFRLTYSLQYFLSLYSRTIFGSSSIFAFLHIHKNTFTETENGFYCRRLNILLIYVLTFLYTDSLALENLHHRPLYSLHKKPGILEYCWYLDNGMWKRLLVLFSHNHLVCYKALFSVRHKCLFHICSNLPYTVLLTCLQSYCLRRYSLYRSRVLYFFSIILM